MTPSLLRHVTVDGTRSRLRVHSRHCVVDAADDNDVIRTFEYHRKKTTGRIIITVYDTTLLLFRHSVT